MLEDKLHTINPTKIKVSNERPRQRKEMGEIEKLVKSIKQFGQIQPIVVTRDMELIAGGRRLAACIAGGFQAKICYSDELNPTVLRELELEENLQRKSLTPAEECLAVDELVKLKQEKLGKPVQGREGGYTLEDAAITVGKTKGNIIESLQIAEMIKSFPDLSKAKTKSEIKKAYKGLQRVGENIAALSSFEKNVKKDERFTLENANAVEHMKKVEDKSIDLLFTDPPYGINISDVAMTIGGHTGGDLSSTGITYNDSAERSLDLYDTLAKESYRFCKDNAHVLVFCAPSWFTDIKNSFKLSGWICAERPIIWVKGASGQNNQPDYWFSSAYEMLLFARKTLSRLQIPGKPDWLQCDIVSHTKKVHQAEKPLPLLKELISRTTLPGMKLYDPFTGSGAILEAGCDLNLISTGCELAVESYATALSRMTKWKERNK